MIASRFVVRLLILGILTLLPYPGNCQQLPAGSYHTDREREIDILHYKAQLTIIPKSKHVSGRVTLIASPLQALNRFSLDANHLEVSAVTLREGDTSRALSFENDEQKLHITLPRNFTWKDTFTIAIDYSTTPSAGMYFVTDPADKSLSYVYTYGEGGLHANWLPIYNDVNDKFTSEMLVTAPLPYSVISNGTLLETIPTGDGNQLFHWKESLPHPNYLLVVYIGKFEKGELAPAKHGTPLSYWVPHGRLSEGAYTFRHTPAMVDFFSERFDYPYPWEKYDQVAIPNFSIGAMEHTTVTGHRASVLRKPGKPAPDNFGPDLTHYYSVWTADGTISHELAHHWFGDNLTCRNLSYIWLNESFATYLQMLWDEHANGEEQFMLDRHTALDRYLEYVHREHIIRPLEYHYFDTVSEIYNQEHTYFKGALILHMLRYILGDEPFFHAMSDYLHKHEFGNVDSHDFQIALEESTGKNLEWFFDDWIYGGGHPVFEVSYRYLPGVKKIDLTIKQVQPIVEGQDLFSLPVEVAIATSSGVRKDTLWVEEQEERFLLPSPEKPHLVSIDGSGNLVAEIHFKKSLPELLYQAKHDASPGRVRALRQLADRFPANPKTLNILKQIFRENNPWWVQAEAALLLGKVASQKAEQLIPIALQAQDYHVRKAVALALPRFHPRFAAKTLRRLINKDPHGDVVAAAIISLAKVDEASAVNFIRQQLGRTAWYDEITLACMTAFENIGEPELVKTIKPFCGYPYNQHVRNAALSAWASCAPQDTGLHQLLMQYARSANYGIQLHAIELLGKRHVREATEVLEDIAKHHGDGDFRHAAEKALEEIERVGVIE